MNFIPQTLNCIEGSNTLTNTINNSVALCFDLNYNQFYHYLY